jgi:hypothetical protein
MDTALCETKIEKAIGINVTSYVAELSKVTNLLTSMLIYI